MIDTIIDLFVNFDEERLLINIGRAIKAGIGKQEIIKTINSAMDIIKQKYAEEELTISDLMMASLLYERVVELKCISDAVYVNPKNEKQYRLLLLTIESDLHDIGKSIFKNIAIASGFEVIDLGVDVKSELICEKIKEYQPDILGISIILTNAATYLKKTMNLIKKENLRDSIKIIIGGSAVDTAACKAVGADAFTDDARQGIEICQNWIKDK